MSTHPSFAQSTCTGALALAIVILSGCASSDSSGEATSGDSASAAAFSQTVDDRVAELSEPRTDPAPEAGPRGVTGKTIAVLPVTMADASATRASNTLVEASEEIGWKATIYDTHASVTEANQKLLQAVTTKVDGIVLVGLDPSNIGSGLAAAEKADIPVACLACWGKSDADTESKFLTVAPSEEVLTDLGRASAEFAYQQTDGHPKFLAMNDTSLTNLKFRQNGFDAFIEECKSAGGDCEVLANEGFQYANTFTTLSAEAASLAQAHPDFNAFWAGFDVAAIPIISGLRQAGLATGETFLVGSQGDGANVKVIADGGYQKATVAISWEWAAYGIIDNFNRSFSNEELIDIEVPYRLFVEDNIAEAKGGKWDGDVDFRSAFSKIWQG